MANLFSFKNVQNLKSVKDVNKKMALCSFYDGLVDEDDSSVVVRITELVAFKKAEGYKGNDSSCSVVFGYYRNGVKKALFSKKVNAVFSKDFFDKYGADLVKVEHKDEEYKKSDIHGGRDNAELLNDKLEVFAFDGFDEESGEYILNKDGEPIYENYIVGFRGEFDIDEDQERKCNKSSEVLPC